MPHVFEGAIISNRMPGPERRWERGGLARRVTVQPQSRAPETRLSFAPEFVHRGNAIEMQAPTSSRSGCPVDVAFTMPEDELMRSGVWPAWVQVNSCGRGVAHVSPDAERGLIRIDHVRACGGPWAPAQGSFVVIP
jgi:hypothetical protein